MSDEFQDTYLLTKGSNNGDELGTLSDGGS